MSSSFSYSIYFILLTLLPVCVSGQVIPYEGLTGARKDQWMETDWVGTDSLEVVYDGNELPISIISKVYQDGQWLNSERYLADYNEDLKPAQELNQRWENGDWVDVTQRLYQYGQSEGFTVITTTLQRWSGEQWDNLTREIEKYNEQRLLVQRVNQDAWSNTYWDYEDRYSYSYNENNDRTFYYYDLVSGILTRWFDPALMEVYPNPSNGSFIVNLASESHKNARLSIFDVAGRRIYSVKVSPGITQIPIRLEGVPGGIYYLNFQTPDSHSTRSVMIRR